MTETTATQATDEQLRALAIERLDLAAEIAERKERIEQIDEVLLQHITEPRTDLVAGFKVRIQQGARRIDAKKIEKAYPAAQYPGLYAAKLDTAAVKKQFAPAALEAFQTQSAPTVHIDEVK
ncbi:hypothetical protein F8O06_02850 [Pseudoclavibacter sp. CFCC 14310]|uniref:hypothetical protein n=1 Tax=Pseudoclavibacter sp. CFCC 14310 TaxID=2615180 RepID=UPI0013019B75|nr:hypothetical protein [Pseudoclavibacter sp. CFCC 14310]KAB1647496.1 hypothetical protein F8O06_02850 [Pseudoclavibacter sp. CFCC 14310]